MEVPAARTTTGQCSMGAPDTPAAQAPAADTTMSSSSSSSITPGSTLESLPRAALQHIFQLVCDSSPPDRPGTCWISPVCKQWRDLASTWSAP
jgi:hypothetical protein